MGAGARWTVEDRRGREGEDDDGPVEEDDAVMSINQVTANEFWSNWYQVPGKETNWESARSVIAKSEFIDELVNFKNFSTTNGITTQTMEILKKT